MTHKHGIAGAILCRIIPCTARTEERARARAERERLSRADTQAFLLTMEDEREDYYRMIDQGYDDCEYDRREEEAEDLLLAMIARNNKSRHGEIPRRRRNRGERRS